MIKFLGKKWFLSVSRNSTLFHTCFDVASHAGHSKRFGVIPREPIILVKNGHQFFIFANQENSSIYLRSLEKICLSPIKLNKLKRTYSVLGRRLLRASDDLEKKISRESFRKFSNAYMELTPGLVLTTMLGRHMQELLEAKLSALYKNISKPELNILVSDITYPDKHTPLVESQISLLTIGAKLQKKKIKPGNIKNHVEIYQLLKNYLKKYSSIPVNFTENPWSEEDITNQLKDLMKEDCQKEKQKISIQHKERIKKSKLILKKINNQKVKNIADSLKAGVFLNEYRKCVFCRASLAYRPLMRAIAEKYGLTSWKECWKLTPQEISRLYFGGDKRILNVLPKRKLVGVMPARNKNNYRFLSDKELALFWSEIEKVIPTEEKAGELKKINGTIANPGIIRGTAKIILGSHDFHKFKEGDIIVATMTSVDFVPLMKRASAFVTNEGGITCHASIVSRELNKPCIIGTKIATKVLKDGDLVEVDANKGIVRIIRD